MDFGKAARIGNPVYYMSYGTPDGEQSSFQRAAIITELVHEGRHVRVGLCVFLTNGPKMMRDVPFSPRPKEGHWSWPEAFEV